MTHEPSSLSKFLVPEKIWYQSAGTRVHDRFAKLLVRDSGTITWTDNLDGVPWALRCALCAERAISPQESEQR